MILSRAPFRITLGGGGTDLPSYYEKFGGFLISATINKYMYVGVNDRFYPDYSLKYSKSEIVNNVEDINHPLIREALKLLDVKPGVEITSLADIPAGTGVGSSGCFLDALLDALHAYIKKPVSKRKIAEEACKIELDILKEAEGKQDKYVCSFGGIKSYHLDRDGKVSIISLMNEDLVKRNLEKKLVLFYT